MANERYLRKEQPEEPNDVIVQTPQEQPPQSWFMESLNRIHTRLDRIEERLRKLENKAWFAARIFALIAILSKIFLPDFDVTIVPQK